MDRGEAYSETAFWEQWDGAAESRRDDDDHGRATAADRHPTLRSLRAARRRRLAGLNHRGTRAA
jgi:hypothetical protein